VSQILQTLQAYLASVQVPQKLEGQQGGGGRGATPGTRRPRRPQANAPEGKTGSSDEEAEEPGRVVDDGDQRPNTESTFTPSQIINLIRVPGVHQVMLQVRIAELNRTAMREIGTDILAVDSSTGNIVGTQIGGALVDGIGSAGAGGLVGEALGAISPSTTGFGIFPSGDFQILLQALRDNSVLTILAEPNLMAMSGHEASFLAGGEFPVPVPGQGGFNGNTIEFKDFGVQLVFVPYVMDNDKIRLRVAPEVSTIDFSIGTTLVVGGDRVPGVNTRKAETTVEMEEGQTLAIAGLLDVELDAGTQRIPGLGDLPYIGPMFSNTSHKRQEKELLVLVTPYLVSPMNADQVGPVPGEGIKDPTDKEFYLLNRIEGRTCEQFDSTTSWDRPWTRMQRMEMEQTHGYGPIGYSR
jgi:pilus assembly protein CpaC